jgi:hypothetical protein
MLNMIFVANPYLLVYIFCLAISGGGFHKRGKLETLVESFSLTFTANVKPLTKFLILQLYYNSLTPILKYKQLLNLCSLAMI